MAITTIEKIHFRPEIDSRTYIYYAEHDMIQAGVLEASIIDRSWSGEDPYVDLGKLQTMPDYRGIGIARIMVENLITWSQEKNVVAISGYIAGSLLLEDTPKHVAQYLQKMGFSIEGRSFNLNLWKMRNLRPGV